MKGVLGGSGASVALASVVLAIGCRSKPGLAPPDVSPPGIEMPPPAPVVVHVDTLHGVAVPDPYRWLEDTMATETRAWVARQERYTTDVLARVVSRDSLIEHFERAFSSAPTLDRVQETPAGLVLTRWLADQPSLHVVAPRGSPERVLLSATDLSTNGLGTIRALVPSWDGRVIALGTTQRGDLGAAVVLVDASTGALLPDRVPDLLTTTSGTRYEVSWLPDDGAGAAAFVYPRLWPGSETGPAAERFARGRQFLHRLGTPQSDDVALFGYGVSPAVPMAPEDLATGVHGAPGSRWLVASVRRSRLNGSEHYAARRVPGDSSVPDWVPLATLADRAVQPQLHGDTAYALMRGGADRGRIMRRLLGDGPTPASSWEPVVPEQRGVITAFALQQDALYFTERVGGGVQLRALPYGESRPRAVALPVGGTAHLALRAPTMSGVLVSVESWAAAPRWFRVWQGGTAVEALEIDDGGAAASSTLVSERLEAPSRDGTLVPVSIVWDRAAHRGGRLDGTAPLLIEAYGAFGQATDPSYDPTLQVWTALGGVYAYAHVRGGGELGADWHRAAMRQHKQRSIDDVIGAVEALVARGHTSPGRVALQGISFGAGIAGIAPMQRPELFGAVIFDVGGPDEIRAISIDPSAARNVAELGDVDSPEGVRLLLSASPYHRVPVRLQAPAMLLHSANDDYNFGTEMLVAKYVARLQAANVGDRPILWVRTGGGHRWLRFVSAEWAATQTAFLFWQLGHPAFQPVPSDR